MSNERREHHSGSARVYLTVDGLNPSPMSDLLDVLAREHVQATFFLINYDITDQTAPIVTGMFTAGPAVGLHAATRHYMLLDSDELASTPTAAERIEALADTRPVRAFRPHAAWPNGEMCASLARIDCMLIGWDWMLCDWKWSGGGGRRDKGRDDPVPCP
jgi:peptidoglycan/xylan/chitin deacetylase (PgdA/CDA1 family)